MTTYNKIIILTLLVISEFASAQVGIGTLLPDDASILELASTTKGFLLPRLTNTKRGEIVDPPAGLVIYNSTTNDMETNIGTPAVPEWNGSKGKYQTVSVIDTTSTKALSPELTNGMILNPVAGGTYSVTFNSQYNNSQYITTTPQIVLDLLALYDELMAKTGGVPHGLGFGAAVTGGFPDGEVLFAGVYDASGPAVITTTLTLDAQNDPSALFIIRVDGQFSTASGAIVKLKNGALAKNVFWVAEGAVPFASGTTMKGVVLSHGGAVSCATGGDIEGRLFSTIGAISCGPGTAVIPTGQSQINLGLLAPYVIFTVNGAVSSVTFSNYTGDIGTVLGAISGFSGAEANLIGTIHPANSYITPGQLIDNNKKVVATFGIYQNGVLIASSKKALISTASAANISLQAIATITAGQPIEVRWNTGTDRIAMGSRTMTVIKVQ
jgi:hypothetical protein